MDIRLRTEQLEKTQLSPYACLSSRSKGRRVTEEPCQVRTAFQRDRDRVIHSKSFRRLKGKTQVFIIPETDHYRTRLTHTLEVAQIARTVAKALRLNEDLTEAIALGHDLGHTPFGHAGEEALNEVFSAGFKHNEQSLRVVEELEGGNGLNLTWEVRDGILNHTGPNAPATLEGQVVKICDRIAYINHDIDDAMRSNIITLVDLPLECVTVLGRTHRERINTMVMDLIKYNWEKPFLKMSPEIQKATLQLRSFLFRCVYDSAKARKEAIKAHQVIQYLYTYLNQHPEELSDEYKTRAKFGDVARVICDYIAGMTDQYAVAQFTALFIPRAFSIT